MTLIQRCILIALLVTISSCGGSGGSGSSNDRDSNQPVDEPNTEPDALVSESLVPDKTLRDCINTLSQAHQWNHLPDINAIECRGEISSIKGLEFLPNLQTLRINAPRLPLDEIPLLTQLPLAAYQRQPFYRNNNQSEPHDAYAVIMQLMLTDSTKLPAGTKVTYFVVVSDDPANVTENSLDWGNPFDEESAVASTGSVSVGDFTTLYWYTYIIDDSASVSPRYGKKRIRPVQFNTIQELPPNGQLNDFLLSDDPFHQCIKKTAVANGWQMIDEVTELDCSSLEIKALTYADRLFSLNHLNLKGNELSSGDLRSLTELPKLRWLNIEDIALSSELINRFDRNGVTILYNGLYVPKPSIQLSVADCGLRIDNFDPKFSYSYSVYPLEKWLSQIDFSQVTGLNQGKPFEPWPSTGCLPTATIEAGVITVKNNHSIALMHPVVGYDNKIQQFLIDSFGLLVNDLYSGHCRFIPGNLSDRFYSFEPSNKVISAYDVASWHHQWSETVDFFPLLSTDNGVYGVKALEQGVFNDVIYHLDRMRNRTTLTSPIPQSAPLSALEFGGELWFYHLMDEWGGRPEIVVWHSATEQWRIEFAKQPATYYKLHKKLGQLCIDYDDGQNYCRTEEDSTWVPSPTASEYELAQTKMPARFSQKLDPDSTIYQSLGFSPTGPLSSTWSYSLWPKVRPFPTQIERLNPDSESWQPLSPRLPGFPLWASFQTTDTEILMLSNDSVVRYVKSP